jgi:hypothetical protein
MNDEQRQMLDTAPEFVRNNLIEAISHAERLSELVDFHLKRIQRSCEILNKIKGCKFKIFSKRLSAKLEKFCKISILSYKESIRNHMEHRRVLEYLKSGGPIVKPFEVRMYNEPNVSKSN